MKSNPAPQRRPKAKPLRARKGASLAPQRRPDQHLALVEELDALAREGLRPDLGLSRILKRERLDPAQRRRLVLSMAAWFRWSALMGEDARPAQRLGLARRLEDLALGKEGVEGALKHLERMLQRPVEPRLPQWIADHYPRTAELRALTLAFLQPPSLWLRSEDERRLRRVLGPLAQKLEPHGHLAGTWRLECEEDLYATDAFLQGLFVLQDPATQAIGIICDARPGQRWLDLCAGAGGKTLLLAARMQGKGMVEALDINARRLDELRRRARRQQVFNLRVRSWDGRNLPSMLPVDGVLIDAPCSGSGTLRRNPDLWHRPEPDVAGLRATQAFLLDVGAARLKPGGSLVYATCSVLASENEAQVEAFLARHPDFHLEPFANPLTGQMTPGTLALTPLQGDQDGTWMARLQREA